MTRADRAGRRRFLAGALATAGAAASSDLTRLLALTQNAPSLPPRPPGSAKSKRRRWPQCDGVVRGVQLLFRTEYLVNAETHGHPPRSVVHQVHGGTLQKAVPAYKPCQNLQVANLNCNFAAG